MDWYDVDHKKQLGDPTTTLDPYLCTMESAAMALQYHTKGQINVWGGELVPYCGRSPDIIKQRGTNLDNAKNAWAHFGQNLEIRTGQSWDQMIAARNEGRGIILQGDYDQMGGASCQPSFLGDHAIFMTPDTYHDPLCSGGKNPIPEYNLYKFAIKLGQRVLGYNGIFFAVTNIIPKTPPPLPFEATWIEKTNLITTALPCSRWRTSPYVRSDNIKYPCVQPGQIFEAHRVTTKGTAVGIYNNSKWYGNDDGQLWVSATCVK